MPKIALHWKILIGLALGVVVGVLINAAWSDATWRSLGVNDAKAFLAAKQTAVIAPTDELVRTKVVERLDALALPQPPTDQPDRERLDRIRAVLGGEPIERATKKVQRSDDERAQDTAKAWVEAALKAIDDGRAVLPTDPNAEAGFAAKSARFIRNANNFVGALFLRLLKFIAVPIVVFSLVAGVASLNDTAKLGRIGLKTIILYLATTALAITIGLVLANIVQPGASFPEDIRTSLVEKEGASAEAKIQAAAEPSPWDTALNVVPTNPFEALAKAEMLQVVFTALLVGIGLTMLPRDKAAPVIAFFDTMTEVVIKIVHIVLILAPYAVFALIAVVVADMGVDVLASLAKYSATVVVGLAIMIFGVYPLVLRLFTKVRYARFFWAISPAQLLAFSSASSGATLPVTMESCEDRLGVHEEVNSFVLPIGATINMDGTALYQGVAAVFIAQMYGLGLDFGAQLTIVLTATLASIGTAAVPGVGIVMLVIVLQSVGIPLEGIAVILGVDRILDMCRTVCNVTGDCMVCAVVATSENAIDDEATVRRRLAGEVLDESPPTPAT